VQPNRKLKHAIIDDGRSQRALCRAADGMAESRLSSIVRGWVEPREDERRAIAAALGKSEDELFTEPESAVSAA
jgi:hypothetical protein